MCNNVDFQEWRDKIMRIYGKYEFCKDVACPKLLKTTLGYRCLAGDNVDACVKTAKEFHWWLHNNMFVLEAPENEHDRQDYTG